MFPSGSKKYEFKVNFVKKEFENRCCIKPAELEMEINDYRYEANQGHTFRIQKKIDIEIERRQNSDLTTSSPCSKLAGKFSDCLEQQKYERVFFDCGKLRKDYEDCVKKLRM